MPELEYMIPCRMTSIDQRTYAVSLFAIVEGFEVVQRPQETEEEAWKRALAPMEVVTLWRRLPMEAAEQHFTQILALAEPDGREDELSRVEFSVPHFRHRVHVELPPLPVGQAGDFLLKLYLRGATIIGESSLECEYPIRVSKTAFLITVDLMPGEKEWLTRPVTGQGGFQALLRRIQSQIAGNRLVLNPADAERLIRYVDQYGSGGFQDRMARIVEQVREQLTG